MDAIISTIVIAILSGGVAVAIVEGIKEAIVWKRNRKANKEDRAEQKKEEAEERSYSEMKTRLNTIESHVAAQGEALKFILFDRIRFLGQAYIAEEEIDYDDRRILNDMHRSYHNGLGGNGDLDILMNEVNKLPLKIERNKRAK